MTNPVVYPGTFDPITYGHVNILNRATRLFGSVVLAISDNPSKSTMFTLDDRVAMAKECTSHMSGVTVEPFGGLLVDYLKGNGYTTVVRGIRVLTDYDMEYSMTFINRQMYALYETVFLMPDALHLTTSSSAVRDIHINGGDVSPFAPDVVKRYFEKIPRKYSKD